MQSCRDPWHVGELSRSIATEAEDAILPILAILDDQMHLCDDISPAALEVCYELKQTLLKASNLSRLLCAIHPPTNE